MQHPKNYYQGQLEIFGLLLKKQKKRSYYVSLLRLLVFILLVYFLYLYHQSLGQVLLILLLWMPVFLFLISKNAGLAQQINKTKQLIAINETELEVLKGNYSNLPDGAQFINPKHDYSYDIDLFGKASFFQYLNRSLKKTVQNVLYKLLTANRIDDIVAKQQAIKDLADRPDWRQNFMATSRMVADKLSQKKIETVLQKHQFFTQPILFYGSLLFSFLSLGVIAGFYLDFIATKFLIYWLLAGLTLVGIFAKKIHRLYQELDLVMPAVSAYVDLLQLIENEGFKSEFLNQKKQVLYRNHKPASRMLKALVNLYQQKEMTQNMIVKLIGNALFLSDLILCYRLEKWFRNYNQFVGDWLESVDFFEAYIALGNFGFNHQDYCYPELVDTAIQIESQGLGHPLIPESKRINNDFRIKSHEFFIITGANMAGKSTFLRTVSLAIVMANMGLPVSAKTFVYRPIKLLTSMRTSDSLEAESSYFFSELKRLQYIVNQIQKDDYFIVLDEILKGTNSKDKAVGSQQFLERLTHSKATGIIATHDLSLCVLEEKYSQIKNYFFDADIRQDELYFDYKLKTGICQNMNASFLLKKMHII